MSAVKQALYFVSSRVVANARENVSGLIFGQHWF
jgi:hypothetical protein